jgi:sarcosine oxidase
MSRHIPALNGDLIHHYTCLYTTTTDEHFLIDHHPAHPNVVYASSCSGHGYKFSAVVGELLADLSLTDQTHPAADFLKGARLGVTIT